MCDWCAKCVTDHAGAVLPIWKVLSDTVIPDEEKKVRPSDMDTGKSKDHARVVRLKLDSGEPLIGLSLISDDVFKVRKEQKRLHLSALTNRKPGDIPGCPNSSRSPHYKRLLQKSKEKTFNQSIYI